MCPKLFNNEEARTVQSQVRELFNAMSPEFREHLIHSFVWSPEKLNHYLNRDIELKGIELENAYNHLSSLLARIEGFSNEEYNPSFPAYEQWLTQESRVHKVMVKEDKKDIARLVGEGGDSFPKGKTSKADLSSKVEDAHYEHLRSENEKIKKRSSEAKRLMKTPQFKKLSETADAMEKVIEAEINGQKHHV